MQNAKQAKQGGMEVLMAQTHDFVTLEVETRSEGAQGHAGGVG